MTPAALFTDDLTHDILAQATRLDVDAIVMSWPAPVASRLRREARCDLLFLSGEPPPGGADLVVAVRDDDDALALIETAGRLAASRGVSLRLLTTNGRRSRRIRQVADRLQRAGVACVVSGAYDVTSTVPPELAGGALVVTSDGQDGPPPVGENSPAVLVHGTGQPGTPGWEERLSRLSEFADAREV
jgi:hypothetical protein